MCGVVDPGEAVEFALQVLMCQVWVVVELAVGKFAPAEFAAEGVDMAVVAEAADGVPELVRRDLAKAQVRRQARDVGLSREVAAIFIVLQALGYKVFEARLRAELADAPGRDDARAPI